GIVNGQKYPQSVQLVSQGHLVQPVASVRFLKLRRAPGFPLFPYTTLFRSRRAGAGLPLERERQDHLGACRRQQVTPKGVAMRVQDRKSTRLNSSHLVISYAVFCLKKKMKHDPGITASHPVDCMLRLSIASC